MTQKLLGFALMILLSGCQTAPPTNYKEVKVVPDGYNVKNELNVCRDGAFADKSILRLYFDNEYVAEIPQSVYSKTRYKIPYDPLVTSISVRQLNGKVVAKLNVNEKTPKKIYIAIASETNSFVPIPLPGLIYAQMKGNRKIEAVTKTAYDQMCGSADEIVLIK